MYTDGYSYEELSAHTGMDINRLRGIIFKARRELQEKLKGLNMQYSA
jgi:DNA-directed RNA polymerase specialized sigma24 family protein